MGLPKLVRDNIPEIIKTKDNKTPVTRTLSDEEYKQQLFIKIQEEVKEVVESEPGEHRLEELADVLELISAIASLDNADLNKIEEIRTAKAVTNGRFLKRIFLEAIN